MERRGEEMKIRKRIQGINFETSKASREVEVLLLFLKHKKNKNKNILVNWTAVD